MITKNTNINNCAKPKTTGHADQGEFHVINPMLAVRSLTIVRAVKKKNSPDFFPPHLLP